MSDQRKNIDKIIHITYFTFTVLSFILLAYVLCLPHINTLFDNEKSMQLMTGWTYTAPDGHSEIVSLPAGKLKENIPDGIRITNTIPSDSSIPINSIARFCVFQSCRIYVDGKIVFQSSDPYLNARHLDKTTGAYWIIQRLPANSAGKKITLEVTSPYADYRRMDNPVYFGTKTSILFGIIHLYFWKFVTAFILAAGGLTALIYYAVTYRKAGADSTFFYIGWFLIWLGGWALSESHMAQFFTGNSVAITFLSFIAPRMCTISFLVYYIHVFRSHWKKWNTFLLGFLTAEMVLSTALQLLQICDYYETLGYYVLLLMIFLITLIFEIIAELLYYHNKASRYLFYGLLVLLVFSAYDVLRFYLFSHSGFGTMIMLGIFCLIIIVCVHEIRKVLYTLSFVQEAHYFKQLATTDPLTGCSNRNVMLEWMDAQEKRPHSEKNKIVAIVSDIDHLKYINDRLGHQIGDKAICITGTILQKYFSDAGICCRTGGDEFTCLLNNLSQTELHKRISHLKQEAALLNQSCEFDYSISIGYSYFDPSLDVNLEHTIYRADQQMYQFKHKVDPSE